MIMIPLVKAIEHGVVRNGNRTFVRLVEYTVEPAPLVLQADLRESD